MNRERFIRKRRSDWQKLERLLIRMQGQRMSRWEGADVTSLSKLYRSVCYDLSLVQSREWGMRLEQYLNDLVAQGHNCLYRSPPRSIESAFDFLRSGFPRLLRKHIQFFIVAFVLFFAPLFISLLVAASDPVLAERLVKTVALEESRKGYSQELYSDVDRRYAEERSFMTGFYVWNNVGIAFRCVAFGAFFGLGTVVVLLFNGITIGTVMGYNIHHGNATNFMSFVVGHSSFELIAIVIAGAAGLLLGWGMIHPGILSRRESVRVHGMDAIKLAAGSGFMLGIAALIEGYWSPLPIPPALKFLTGSLMWGIVFVYLAFGGRETIDKAFTEPLDGDQAKLSADEVTA